MRFPIIDVRLEVSHVGLRNCAGPLLLFFVSFRLRGARVQHFLKPFPIKRFGVAGRIFPSSTGPLQCITRLTLCQESQPEANPIPEQFEHDVLVPEPLVEVLTKEMTCLESLKEGFEH